MNNLYKKIHEAVNDGIQKALIIDNGQSNDVSVIMHHHKTSSDVNIMYHLVHNLLNENENEYYYDQIITYHKNTGHKYICQSIDELRQIFNILQTIKTPELKWIDLSHLETQITLILDDNSEIPLEKYNIYVKPIFLKISDTLSKYDDMLISLFHDNHLVRSDKKWQCTTRQMQERQYLTTNIVNVVNDYDGYSTCQRILRNKKQFTVAAIEYCDSLCKNGYRGYLPSAGQMLIILNLIDIINNILHYIYKPNLDIQPTRLWWTCNECSSTSAWVMTQQYGPQIAPKNIKTPVYILPLFKEAENPKR